MKKLNKKLFPIILVLLGILDQSTDLFSQLLVQLNTPEWVGTMFKIFIITVGAFKIYLIQPKE